MKWIGLTGGIASGKSTASRILTSLGETVVDADLVAREVVEPNSVGLQKIVELFGKEIVLTNGELDRKKLGQIIFGDKSKRQQLESILHPLIQNNVAKIKQKLIEKNIARAFYDIPLLFETHQEQNFDLIIVVATDDALRLQRLIQRDGLSDLDAKKRLEAQMPLNQKTSKAHIVWWNNKSEMDLKNQIIESLRQI